MFHEFANEGGVLTAMVPWALGFVELFAVYPHVGPLEMGVHLRERLVCLLHHLISPWLLMVHTVTLEVFEAQCI